MDVRARKGSNRSWERWLERRLRSRVTILEHRLRFQVDVLRGHKTGFYLDQRENRRKIALYCEGREVLNVFSYSGAFAVYAAAHGAAGVTDLDSSADALQMAADNLRLNGFAVRDDDLVEGDACQVLRYFRDEGRQFDLVILDPPKFAFSQAQVQAATRGYKDINMLGMRLLRQAQASCAHSPARGWSVPTCFEKVLFGASVDVAREARIVEFLLRAATIPSCSRFPNQRISKGFICHIV